MKKDYSSTQDSTRCSRRTFLGAGAAGAAAASGLLASPRALARLLTEGPRPQARFVEARAHVGQTVRLVVELPEDGPVELLLEGAAGWRRLIQDQIRDGRLVHRWQVPRAAVPAAPGVHQLRLAVKAAGSSRWISAEAPLEIVVNRFAFGL